MSGIDIGGIVSGFDSARRTYRDAELKKAQADQDREFSILQALAQHMDPEMAAVGAAGLLQLAEGGPKVGKGLRGFLGEVDRSSALPSIRALLGAGQQAPTPQPGSAAQPNTAVVEPERQARGPGMATAPPVAPAGEGPPGMALPGAQVGAGGAPPGMDAGGGAPGGPPGLLPATGPLPQPPETPQQKMRRLYPSAGEIAANQTFLNLQARLNAVLQGIRAAKTPQEQDLVRGIAGAPRRATNTKPQNAEFRTADGRELSGTVIFDPATGVAEVDGEPVTILKLLPTNAPRPIAVSRNVGGVVTRDFMDPNNLGGPPLASVDTNMPVPAPPSPYSGTVTTDEGVFRLPRGGGEAEKVGNAPPRAGELTPEQQEATGWLRDVDAEVKAALSGVNQNRPSGMKATALPTQQQNAIVAKVTRNRYKTIGELTAATKRSAGGTSSTTESPRDRANRVRQRLESQQPSRVQGPGMPPG